MNCKGIEDKARTAVFWLLFVLLNVGIAAASASTGPWWVGHVTIFCFVAGLAFLFVFVGWLVGEISICRDKK